MATRDVLAEIASLRRRNLRRSEPFSVAMRRLSPILRALAQVVVKKRLSGAEREFLRTVPVSLVACIEGYFKHQICHLIDLGPPYLQNAADFKEVKVTLEGLVQSHSRRITVGEILSHSLRFNSLEDIDRNMTVVLGRPFLELIKSREEFDRTHLANVAEVFRRRHIVAHELAPDSTSLPTIVQEEAVSTYILMLATKRYLNVRLSRRKSAA